MRMCRAITLAVVGLMILVWPAHAQTPDPTLILSLSFDEGSGDIAHDLSEYGNDGTLNGDPDWVDGKFEKALQFDGVDDFVEVPHADILTVDEDVAVMAWVYAERHAGPGGAGWQGILSKSNSPRSYSFYTTAAGALHFSTAGTGSVSTAQVPLDEWVHVVGIVADGSHLYYVNGEPGGQGGGGVQLPGAADTATVLVGKTHEGSREFLGMIDEVRIWNRALDADEVLAEMERSAGSAAVNASGKLTTTWAKLRK